MPHMGSTDEEIRPNEKNVFTNYLFIPRRERFVVALMKSHRSSKTEFYAIILHFKDFPSSKHYVYYLSQSTQLHMGNHVAPLLHQDHISRALGRSPKLRLFLKSLSHKFVFMKTTSTTFICQALF